MNRLALVPVFLFLAACAGTDELVYVPGEAIKVPIGCDPSGIPETIGNDLAPPDSDIFDAARYVRARLETLRAEIDALRKWESGCTKQ